MSEEQAPQPDPKQIVDQMLVQIASQAAYAYEHTKDARIKAVADAAKAGLDVDSLLVQIAASTQAQVQQPSPRQSQDAQRESYRQQQVDHLNKLYEQQRLSAERDAQEQQKLNNLLHGLAEKLTSQLLERQIGNVSNDGRNSPGANSAAAEPSTAV